MTLNTCLVFDTLEYSRPWPSPGYSGLPELKGHSLARQALSPAHQCVQYPVTATRLLGWAPGKGSLAWGPVLVLLQHTKHGFSWQHCARTQHWLQQGQGAGSHLVRVLQGPLVGPVSRRAPHLLQLLYEPNCYCPSRIHRQLNLAVHRQQGAAAAAPPLQGMPPPCAAAGMPCC